MKYILVAFLFTFCVYPQQDPDIKDYLKKIETGSSAEVKKILPDLKSKYPGSGSLLYLEGILTEYGESAAKLFSSLVDQYPSNMYADAAIYRLFSYYRIISDDNQTAKYSEMLRKNYPASPYVKYMPPLKQNNTKDEKFNYTVQAGAFSDSKNAENLRKRFEKAGYYTYVKDKTIGGTIFKIVFTGRFVNREEAEDFQVILDRKFGIKGIVARYQE